GAAEITFDAGFGPDWADVPADLAQAVFLLATRFYEHRGGTEAEITPDVAALIAPYRSIRLFGGAA
ncbi:MAG: head-tail connector protein, partial [Haliea sp.]